MRLRLLIAVATLPVVLWAVLPLPGEGASLSSKIEEKRGEIQRQRSKEGVLTSDIRGFSSRIASLQSDITVLAGREARIQADLDRKLARLAAIQGELRAERARLVRLRARLEEARKVLSKRLLDLYKADSPDIMTVVLNSDGFADLLQNSEFARRIGRQDNRIIANVQEAKAEATATAKKLAALEDEAQALAAAVQQRRDEVVEVKDELVGRRDQYARARSEKNTVLASVREERQELEGDLSALEAQQVRIASTLRGSSGGGPIGPQRVGGRLAWPVNGPVVSPFGMRWGRLHAGVDIASPSGTPMRAAGSGTVAIAGWVSGYGNYTCINHGGGLSSCYGHQSSIGTSVGARVAQGQVIGSVGCTGHCYGPHVHFETRINGTPVDPMGYL